VSSGSARKETVVKTLEKLCKRWEEDITAIKLYVALAGTLCRVGADNAKLVSLPSHIITDEKGARPLSVLGVTDQCREILIGRSEYVGKSVPEEGCRILREAKHSMHAEELLQCDSFQ